MRNLLYLITTLVFLVVNGLLSYAQTFNMTNGTTVNTCTGTFYDSGGAGGNYGSNEDVVFTICPSGGTGLVQVNFTSFASETGYDYLEIHNGTATTAPSLGVFNSGTPPSVVSATIANASGCLTFHFVSDGGFEAAGWAATISCTNPCQTVNANLSNSTPAVAGNGAIQVCPGTAINFQGSGIYPDNGNSYTQSDASSTFEWDFGDGGSANAQNVNHTYNTPGVYVVNLLVTDVIGCNSANNLTQVIHVSPDPIFDGTSASPDPICLGETSTLTGVATPVTIQGDCTPPVSGTTFLPDGSGQSYQTSVVVTCYAPGQTITNVSEIQDICLNMEHSYTGDLGISIICPNGQTMQILTYAGNSGGGAILGEPVASDLPVDGNTSNTAPGVGYDYCWTPTATGGNIDNNAVNIGSYTDLIGQSSPVVTQVPAGTYAIDGNWGDLIGCPLDGDWTIEVTDNLNSDNGYIFSWGITLDPSLTPGNLSFTPTITSESWQANPDIVSTTGSSAVVQPTTTGSNCYTYEITDDIGCTHDTTICVTVNAGLVVNDQTVTVCENPVGSGTSVNVNLLTQQNAIDGGAGYTFTWYNDALLTSPVGTPNNVTVTDGQVFYAQADDGNCTATATVTYNFSSPITITPNVTDETCAGSCDGSISMSSFGGTGLLTETLSDGGGNSIGFGSLCPGTYTIEVEDALGCEASTTATVGVNTTITANIAPIGNQCFVGNSFNFEGIGSTISAGTITSYDWTFGDAFVGTVANPTHSYAAAGSYTVTLTVSDGTCTDIATQNLTVYDMPTINATGTNVTCNGQDNGVVSAVASGTSGYTYAWDIPAAGPNQTNLGPGTYTATVTDVNGCTSQDSYTVTEPPAITASIVGTNVSCNGASDGTATVTAGSGTGLLTYVWAPAPGAGQGTSSVSGLDGVTYTVTVEDENGCQMTQSFTPIEPTLIDVKVSSTAANCGAADGILSVTSLTGGSGTYTSTVWTDNATGNVVANPNAVISGAYTVTVTDDQGCIGTATVAVAGTSGPTLNLVSQVNASCALIDNGSATVNASGGTGAITYTWSPAPGGGQGTANATGLIGGQTYTVTADASGCTDVLNVTIGTDPDPMVSITVDQNVLCNGACNGEATATATGGTPTYTYQWSNGETTQQATALCLGNHNLTITDANGCTATASTTINEPNMLSVSITGTDPLCAGGNDGSADVTIAGGIPTYSTNWAHGPTVEDLTGVLSSGTYTLTVTDGNGCSIVESVTLNDPPLIATSITGTDISCNGASDGTSTVTASGGTGTLTYNWSPAPGGGQGTAAVTGLLPTTYTVTITDGNACTVTESYTPNQPASINLAMGSTHSNCGQADGLATVFANGGTPVYTYSWVDGANNPIGGNSPSLPGVPADTYTVTVVDSKGCTATSSVSVADQGGGTLANTVTNVSCNGENNGAIDLSLIGGTPGFTYSWSGPSGFVSSTEDIGGLVAGDYDISVTDAVGCVLTSTITVTEPDPLVLTPAGQDVICNGGNTGEVSASATGGTPAYTFEWYDNAALTNNIGTGTPVTGLVAGTYYVEVIDGNDCTADASITISEPAAIAVTVASTDANCGQNDGAVSVSSTAGGSGTYVSETWVDGSMNVITTPGSVFAGSYTVTVTDNLGCTGSAIANVQDLDGPVISLDLVNPATCNGTCNGSIDVNVTSGTSPYNYSWSNNPATGQGTELISDLCAGQYTLTLSDQNGCQDNLTVDVTEPSLVDVTIDAATDASGNGLSDGTATASTAGGTSGYTYEWFIGCPPTTSTGITTALATGLASGDYTVVATDANDCTDSECVTINQPDEIKTSVTATNATCFGGCDGSANVVAIGGVPGYTYQWFDALTGNALVGQTGVTASNLCEGAYYVIVTDANSVTHQSNSVQVSTPAQISAATSIVSNFNGEQISCFGACDGVARVIPAGGTPPYTYLWNDPSLQTTDVAINLCAGTYTVTVTDINSCSEVFSVTLAEPDPITNTINVNDVSCFGACDGVLTANPLGGTGSYTYQWDDPSLSTSVNAQSLCSGVFNISIEDANGCVLTDNATVSEPTEIVLTTNSVGSNCSQSDGEVSVGIVSGDGPLSIQWNAAAGSSTNANVNGLSAGCYDVTVTDVQGCNTVETVCVLDLGSPQVEVLTLTDVSCFGACDGFAQVQVTAGSNTAPPLGFEWFDTGMNPIGQSSASATNLCAGNYVAEMTDGNGCRATIVATIESPPALNSTMTSITPVTCFGDCDGRLEVLTSGGAPGYTYSWNDPANQTTAAATSLCPGTYTVTITDVNGCTSSETATVNEPDQIIVSTSNVDAFCNTATGGATVRIIQGGDGSTISYSWAPSGQTTPTAVSLVPDTYVVTVTDADGCQGTASVTVENIPEGVATAQLVSDALCNGTCDGAVTVSMGGSGTAPYTYEWFTAATNTNIGQTNQNAVNLCPGDYYVIVTDANGCVSTSNTVTVGEPTALGVAISSIDANCKALCDGSAFVTATGGVLPYSYLWNDPLAQNTSSVGGLCSGTYTVTVTDANGCEINDDMTIGEPTAILLDSTVTNSNCNQADGAACVTASGGTAPYTYSWPIGGVNSCESSLVANSYVVTVTDGSGCSEQIVVEVSDLAGPQAEIIDSTRVSCFGNCDGAATVDMVGGSGTSFVVRWDGNTGSQTTPTASNLCAGLYTVILTDDLGCNASTSIIISEPDAITTNLGIKDPSCFGYCDASVGVVVAGGTSPYNYTWRDAVNATIGSNNDTISALCTGAYSLEVVDVNGCTELVNYTLNNPAQVTAQSSSTDVLCNSACDGTATAIGNIGVGNFTYAWDAAAGNQTTGTATGLCPGTYTCVVTDANGCFTDVSTTITEPPALSADITISGNLSCNGTCDGFAEVDVAGGTAPYSFDWGAFGNTQVAIGLCAGTYTATVTDVNGCTATTNVVIAEPTALGVNSTVVNSSCYGVCDGSATVNVSGGAAPYTYQWDDPGFQTTSSISNLCGGTYTCTITDAKGCSTTESIIITEPTLLSLVTSSVSDANCGQSNGEICVSAVGGVGPFTYAWNDPNNSTTACLSNAASNCYQVTVLDGNGCSKDSVICLNDIAGPVVNFLTTTNVSCFGANDGTMDFFVSSPTGGLTYELSTGGNVITTGVGPYTGLSGGTYDLQVTDAAGCVGQDIGFVFEPNALNSAITSSVDVTCNLGCNGRAVVSVSGGITPYSISWNDPATQTTNLAENLCAGTYTATVTDANLCQSLASITINEPPALAIQETTTNVSCNAGNDGLIDITVTGGTPAYNYQWIPNVSSGSIAGTLTNGSYNVNVTDANGCIVQSVIPITEPAPLVVSASSVNSTCTQCNGSASVSASGGTGPYTYQWLNGGSNPNAATNLQLCPGTHTVIVTDVNGCSETAVITITDEPAPIINSMASTEPPCNGGSNGSATVVASGGTGVLSYAWDVSAGNQTSATASGLEAGTYCVIVSDVNNCTVTQCVVVLEPAPINGVPDGSTAICHQDSTQIWASGQGGTPPYTINWQVAGFTGTGPIMVSPTSTESYCFTVTDNNGCLASSECITVTVQPPISLSIDPAASICAGDTVNASVVASDGNGGPYTFTWLDENGATVPDTTVGSVSTISVDPRIDNKYYVTVGDGCSLEVIDSIQISLNPLPTAFLNVVDSEGCIPFDADFIVNSDIGVNYDFDYQCDGIVDYSGPDNSTSWSYTTPGVYNVCLTVTSADGCQTTVSDSGLVEVFSNPTANFSSTPSITSILDPTIGYDDLSSGATTYRWNFGDGDTIAGIATDPVAESNTTGTVGSPVHTYNASGTYDVTLIVTNSDGCTHTVSYPVTIEPDFSIYVPNSFTPNGDGLNDEFTPVGEGMDSDNYHFYIYNRWGELIWESHNIDKAWNGIPQGGAEVAQTDVYVWLVETKDPDGKPIRLTGHVTIIK